MLARLTAAKSFSPDFDRLLVIPERPAAIAEADVALQKAVAARQAGQQRHVEAGQRLALQPLGQPPKITQHDVDAIGAELEPLFAAEAEARAHRDELVQAYDATILPALVGPFNAYRDAIAAALDQLDGLLAEGVKFRARAKYAGVDLNRLGYLPGCIPPMIERLDLVRKVFAHGNRT